jgi:hypothetical protein
LCSVPVLIGVIVGVVVVCGLLLIGVIVWALKRNPSNNDENRTSIQGLFENAKKKGEILFLMHNFNLSRLYI